MRLFTYGTLMYPELMAALCGRELQWRPATLLGYRRRALRGAAYPVVVSAPSERVEGRLYEGLCSAEIRRLDRYEGQEYRRESVELETDAGPVYAWCYLLKPAQRQRVLPYDWDVEAFARRHLARYRRELRRC